MLLLHLLLFRTVRTAEDSDSTCHGSVLFHRGESILPSTGLFCVVRSNEDTHVDNVPIIQTNEQWEEYLVANPELQPEQIAPDSSPSVLLVRKDNDITEFLLPTSFIGTKCSGTQQVVLGFSQSASCSPLFYPFNETECLSNEFLSAQTLFQPTIVSYGRNISLETSFHSNFSFLPVQWQLNQCQNVIQEVSLEVVLNDTLVADAVVTSIHYTTLTAANHSAFTQTFNVNYRSVFDTVEGREGGGYIQGQEIYALQGDESPVLFSLPISGPCSGEGKTPIKFLVNTTTGCTIRASRCDEAQQAVQRLLEKFAPTRIFSSPPGSSTNHTHALVIFRNRTEGEASASSGCLITTGFMINVHFAKQGSTKSNQQFIVSATYDLETEKIPLTAETTAVVRFAVAFKDVTPPPSFRFAALPHIDLRLPNDFFYPFLAKSTTDVTTTMSVVMILLVCLL
ncbi:hypothetical protein Y032_0062g3315 [Ancylostoma ceylanicum]|uniref:Tectonic-1-3 domain-containing protein n=1 Tax=Ancylostoma ceylanicum TaxID=53326 RepID=A0A016U193_9BILA|nr:hypothetical protein Y032_0062g3315 [Ancylostoma ceylanicum]